MLQEASYPIASRGLATSFTEPEVPVQYATKLLNRYINAAGGAEKRQGIQQIGSTITGTPVLNSIHELVGADGTATMLVSGEGNIWSYNDSAGTSTLVHTGLDATAKIRSVQMGSRLIFYNGVDRNIYTEDGTNFRELKAIIEQGSMGGTVSATGTDDSDISSWITDTNVAVDDVVHNISLDAYGIITSVASANVLHTNISTSALGIGTASAQNASGDLYEIIDTVELNVIPTSGASDNVATLGAPSSATFIAVSAVPNWVATEARIGDFIHNTTRSALTQVTAISTAGLGVHGISTQVVGDAITLHKSAMPIAQMAHVHYGRLFQIDARDQRKIRISGANDPQDQTTDAGTLNSTTFSFSDIQPKGDIAVTMGTFLKYFAVAGRSNLYLFEGSQPIADVSALATDTQIRQASDWALVAIFPQGVVGPDSLISIGNDLAFVTKDGVQTISLIQNSSQLSRGNLSESIKSTLRDEIKNNSSDRIKVIHYPRRSWLLVRVGSLFHCFNYTAFLGQDQFGDTLAQQGSGSWSDFDGKFAQLNDYFIRANGDFVGVGNGGKIYQFDTGAYDDDGENIVTSYRSGWLTLAEPRSDVRTKQIHYIKPIVDAGDTIRYTIRGEAGFDLESTDTITVSASSGTGIGLAEIGVASIGGSSVINVKYPLRVRGERVRVQFDTDDQLGPDTLSRYTLYFTKHGKR